MASKGQKYAEKFKALLEEYPNPETGKQWRTVDFERGTNGYLTRSYIASLASGRINHPGVDRLQKISELMGFPFELWLTDQRNWERSRAVLSHESQVSDETDIAMLLNKLIEVVEEENDSSYTDQKVSYLSKGTLSEDLVKALRDGTCDNPSYKTLLALSEAFDVDPAYWFSSGENDARLDYQSLEALREEKNYLILQKTAALTEERKNFVLTMLDNLEGLEVVEGQDARS